MANSNRRHYENGVVIGIGQTGRCNDVSHTLELLTIDELTTQPPPQRWPDPAPRRQVAHRPGHFITRKTRPRKPRTSKDVSAGTVAFTTALVVSWLPLLAQVTVST